MEMKLGTHAYYMTTRLFEQQRIASGTLFKFISSLLKLSNGSTNGG